MDWMAKPLEERYRDTINWVARIIREKIDGLTSVSEIQEALKSLPGHKNYQDMAEHMALRMATMANKEEARNWKQAASKASKGRLIYEAIQEEMRFTNPVGQTVRRLSNEHAHLIKTLPLSVSTSINKFIGTETYKGLRSAQTASVLKEKISEYTKANATLIARTESSKAMTALTRARSEAAGVEWYIWKTANDGNRVRPSHRLMQGVLCRYNDPPAPEELNGEETAGHYNAGNIYNCRCFPRPLIDLGKVNWPAKVYYSGAIHMMSKEQFIRTFGYAGFSASEVKPFKKPKQVPVSVKPSIAQPNTNLPNSYKRQDVGLIHTLKNWFTRKQEFGIKQKRTENDYAKENLQTMVKNGACRMRIPEQVLDKIAVDGRFKTQFETGNSRGSYSPNSRKKVSKLLFGTDIDTTPDNGFEKYGYLGDKDIFKDIGDGNADNYGSVLINFKDEHVRYRTTFTVDDSLGPGSNERLMGSPLEDVTTFAGRESVIGDIGRMKIRDDIKPSDVIGEVYCSYIELQYHGELTLDDVESIVVTSPPRFSEETKAKLRSLGINVLLADKYGKTLNPAF